MQGTVIYLCSHYQRQVSSTMGGLVALLLYFILYFILIFTFFFCETDVIFARELS